MNTDLKNLKYNQSFAYQDGTARFILKNDKSGKAMIEFNGKIIMVDYNDLFGMNYAEQMKKRNIAAIDNRIATVQASYEEYCAKIEAAKLTSKTEAKKQGFLKSAMAKILGRKEDKDELSGTKASEYAELESQLKDSTKNSDRASSDIYTYSIWAADEAYYKHDLYCQRSIAESILG